ncbi:tyrosine-type recombinase/integrase [Patescibacteria group bacterium]|nr:tyrosine-type recombinase/integrase [Candidatus Falkowbacteria bacterium]MBU3905468.1 tyrosine-type recombinase/integrase [Patescibacteria group bacterium]MCG2697700.1 tyrosine-type recombinase/integrase [Candidatus Parcubacteria bacterium]MBU4015301.1 tyrosine-type recombinase/integrase [Patescibacteria group bacterium]MBU4026035.1 tyrosine-type recombinase/integrase [Patescibacteria group bacterium]
MDKKNKTIIEYHSSFLDYLEIEKGLSSNTQKNYSRFLNKFFKWLDSNNLKSLKPSQLSLAYISKYRIFLARHVNPRNKITLKKSTQNYYLIALRSLLEFFVEKNIASLSPSQIKLAKDKSDKEIKFLKLEQIEKLLLAPDTSAIIGSRDRAILETLFSTGLRVAELTALDREQFKITELTKNLEVVIVGKGNKVRTIYFSERAVCRIKKYLDQRDDIDNALFINYKRGAEKSSASRRLTTKSIEDIVKKYIKIAGLPIIATPHTIRHSFATDLLAQGVDLRLVQEFLGHRNIATTQIYTHVTNKQLQDVHKKLHGGRKIKN